MAGSTVKNVGVFRRRPNYALLRLVRRKPITILGPGEKAPVFQRTHIRLLWAQKFKRTPDYSLIFHATRLRRMPFGVAAAVSVRRRPIAPWVKAKRQMKKGTRI